MRKTGLREGTFSPNRNEPIHRWYPYIEGYSSALVESELDACSLDSSAIVYDPFAGTGTTPLSGSIRGYRSCFSETNPFMRFVIETKVNTTMRIAGNSKKMEKLNELAEQIDSIIARERPVKPIENASYNKYFNEDVIQELLVAKSVISNIADSDIRSMARLALSSILVPVSKMVRRGDLRFATEKERSRKAYNVAAALKNKLIEMVADIESVGGRISSETHCLSEDVRLASTEEKVDCIITSPPYLNGTNYIRNTKLELMLNDYVSEESGLSSLHATGIVAGINNVTRATRSKECLPEVEEYYKALVPVAYDKRIPTMVTTYFDDMDHALGTMSALLKKGGILVMDIGDSQFAGVHIPTHELLAKLAINHGLILSSTETLRTRRSKNGMQLTQKLMRFENGGHSK